MNSRQSLRRQIFLAWVMVGLLLCPLSGKSEVPENWKPGLYWEQDPAVGTLDWAGAQLVSEVSRLVGAYRAYTGDPQFDDVLLAAGSGYARFLASGDPRDVEADHAGELNSMRVNLPMVTSEVQGTDRVALRPGSLLGPLTGSPVSITQPPSFAVTWRDVGPDFTALVRRFDARSLSAWVYSFAAETTHPTARFWRLQPGRYELRLGPDADGDGQMDGTALRTIPFTYRQRLEGVGFELPAQTLGLVEVTQLERWPDPPAQRPDLAVMPRDVTLEKEPAADRPVRGTVIVHNIGSAEASNVNVAIRATPISDNAPPILVERVTIPTLAGPANLQAQTAPAHFTWIPPAVGEYRLEVVVTTEEDLPEIFSGNNRAEIRVNVP